MRKKCFLHSVPGHRNCTQQLMPDSKLTPHEARIIRLRSRCKKTIKFICKTHYKRFVNQFPASQKSCCDPLPEPKCLSKKSSRSLYTIDLSLRDRGKKIGIILIPGRKLCVHCKLRLFDLLAQPEDENHPVEPIESSQRVHSSDIPDSVHSTGQKSASLPSQKGTQKLSFDTSRVDLEGLNKWLQSQGFDPITVRKISRLESYDKEVLTTIKAAVEKCTSLKFKEDERIVWYNQMVDQLTFFIEQNPAKSKKVLALTIVANSMTYSQIEETFHVTNHMAKKARFIVEHYGILHEPGARLGRRIPSTTAEKVTSCYLRDDVSRPLPGKKDEVAVRDENGVKTHQRKRLVLGTLSSLHDKYVKEFPDFRVSRGKFCELRPKQCVLAGQAGSHVICVCTYHENPGLMFEHGHLKSDTFKSAKDFIALMLCPEPTRKCRMHLCENCPDDKLQEVLEVHLDMEMIDQVTYNQWLSTDRGNIATLTDKKDDFITNFIAQVEILIPHDFVYQQQFKFFKNLMENLKEGEVIVSCDFGENYTVVIQRSSQTNYFNGQQITLHPFVGYYREQGVLKHFTLLVVSDHLDHSTTAVHVFQEKLIQHLRYSLKLKVDRIYYQSDGCAAQYKNKKAVANVWFHQHDFNISAEWHYHATAHGKSACDGITGRAKSLVYQFSLQATKPEDHITTAPGMSKWLQEHMPGITTVFVPTSEVVAREKKLMVRFGTAHDIDGIQFNHAIIPKKASPYVIMKVLSWDTEYVLRKISIKEIQLDFEDVKGFILYSVDRQNLSLGNVIESDQFHDSFLVQTLDPTGKPLAYSFSEETDNVNLQDVISIVAPYFQKKGSVVKLRSEDMKAANVKLMSMQ